MAAGFSPSGRAPLQGRVSRPKWPRASAPEVMLWTFPAPPSSPADSFPFPCHPEQTRRSEATERAVRDLHFSVACHGPLLLGLSELRRRLGKGTTAKPAVSETFWEGHDFSRATNAQIQYRL